MDPFSGKRIDHSSAEGFYKYIEDIGKKIESNSLNKNKHLKIILQESKRDLFDMMDESYQDAFNIEVQKGKK